MKTNHRPSSWPAHRLDRELAARNPEPDAAPGGAEDSVAADALLQRIVATPPPQLSRPPGRPWRMPETPAHQGRTLLAVAAVGVGLAVAVGLAVSDSGGSPGSPTATSPSTRGSGPISGRGSGQPGAPTSTPVSLPAAQLVAFTTSNGEVIARITDPTAAASQLDSVFRAHGFDISIQVLPVSPSMVGTIVEMSQSAGTSTLSPIQAGTCLGGGAQCTVGLILPADFHGQASVAVGRAARPGEAYDSADSSFGAGEALHCSGVLNERVSAAAATVAAKGLSIRWQVDSPSLSQLPQPSKTPRASGTSATGGTSGKSVASPTTGTTPGTIPPPADYVTNGVPISSTEVMLEASPQPLPASSSIVEDANQGC